MTRDEAREFAKVVKAYADGAVIQYKGGDDIWREMKDLDFCAPMHCYRIKPEPREWWAVVDRDGAISASFRGCDALERANEYAVGSNRDGIFAPYTVSRVREVTE